MVGTMISLSAYNTEGIAVLSATQLMVDGQQNMTRNTLPNRRLAALVSLLAAMLFIVVTNAHRHGQFSYGENGARLSLGQNVRVLQISQAAIGQHQPHCLACELMFLGSGNTIITPATQIQAVSTQEAFVIAVQRSVQSDYCNLLPSRAPPA